MAMVFYKDKSKHFRVVEVYDMLIRILNDSGGEYWIKNFGWWKEGDEFTMMQCKNAMNNWDHSVV